MTHTTKLYFEAHVTCDPVFKTYMQERFAELCKKHKFRPAKLFMQKGKDFAPSDMDMFCTTRSVDYDTIYKDTIDLVGDLAKHGFGIRRYKIENTLLDERIKDE